jgi:hypothetical protein
MDAIIKRWRGGNLGGISINRNMVLDTLLFADDQVLIATSEDELQRAITKDCLRLSYVSVC